MTIEIIYQTTSAYGFPMQHSILAHTFEKAEEYCQAIERAGYKLIDVTRDVYSD